MSIINDALKKAQESLDKKNNKSPYNILKKKSHNKSDIHIEKTTAVPFPAQSEPLAQKDNTSKNLIISTSIIIIFIIAFSTATILLIKKYMPQATTIKQSNAKEKSQKTITSENNQVETKDKLTTFNNNLKLEGTMMMDDKRVALINGEVYKLGEQVNGMKIITINLENVELIDSYRNTITLGVKK